MAMEQNSGAKHKTKWDRAGPNDSLGSTMLKQQFKAARLKENQKAKAD
jgi:hypothetical protein